MLPRFCGEPTRANEPLRWEGDDMHVGTRIARDTDLLFLREVDGHVSPQDVAHLVSLGRVMVAEVDGVPLGCLRWACSGTKSPS